METTTISASNEKTPLWVVITVVAITIPVFFVLIYFFSWIVYKCCAVAINILEKQASQKLYCVVNSSVARGKGQWRIQKILVGGDLKHKTSKIRMSSPKLRVIFRPNSEIQPFFSPKFRWSPKKKKRKKVFTKIESDFSAEIGNSNVFFARIQVVSKKKKKKKGLHQN